MDKPVEGRRMSGDLAPKVKLPPPLTMFDTLRDAALVFSYNEGENSIIITVTKENTRPVKYTITKPTVEKLRRWLRSVVTHM
jgi:hypothetical protein